MASSSVSAESLDRDDSYDLPSSARRSRVPRALRHRGSASIHKSESLDSGDHNGYEMTGSVVEAHGDGGGGGGGVAAGVTGVSGVGPGLVGALSGAAAGGDHDSPTRSATSRAKDREKRVRPNHLQKGKTAKDKRKLREKRRSTGVVHLPSTESTGDSLDEEDADKLTGETKRNTSYNEVIDADNPQTPEESRGYNRSRNKSPSDLEADLEDNQDYDSTVSQSETNLTIIGQASPQTTAISTAGRLPANLRSRVTADPSTGRPAHHHGAHREDSRDFTRPVSYPSRFRDGDRDLETTPLGGSRPLLHGGSKGREQAEGSHYRSTGSRDSYQHYHRGDRSGSGYSSNSSAELIKLQARSSELERLLEAEREEKRRLQKQIEQEREEKSRLRQMLDSRDLQVSELQREIHLLGSDFDLCCEDNEKLQQENAALVRAFSQLSAT